MRKRPAHNLDKCLVPNTADILTSDHEKHATQKSVKQEHWDCLEWPEFRDWNFLEAQRALLRDEMFEAVYQQVARIPGARPFPPEVVRAEYGHGGILDSSRRWKTQEDRCPRCNGQLYTTLGFDPAAGEGKRASYSALAVLDGCQSCRSLFVVDYWYKRQSPELHATTISTFADSFNVMYVRVEINAYQKALARDQVLRDAAREHHFIIDEHMTDDRKNTSEFGIPNLSRYMTDGHFSVPYKTKQDQDYANEFLSSFIRYPQKPNDVPMSVWLAAGMMWEIWDSHMDLGPSYLPGREDHVPQYLIDNPPIFDLGIIGRDRALSMSDE